MTNIATICLKVKLVETIRIDPRYSPGSKIRKLRNISFYWQLVVLYKSNKKNTFRSGC